MSHPRSLRVVLLLVVAVWTPTAMADVATDRAARVAHAGVVFSWRFIHAANGEPAMLEGTLVGPASGWVLVGFGDGARLAGSRLVFAVAGQHGDAHLEQHLAVVPTHHAIDPAPRLVRASRRGTTQRVTFRIEARGPDAAPVHLRPGADVFLTLAWSRDPDVQHHSAQREGRRVTL